MLLKSEYPTVRRTYQNLDSNHYRNANELHKRSITIRQSDELDLSAINADIRLLRKVTECDILEDDL